MTHHPSRYNQSIGDQYFQSNGDQYYPTPPCTPFITQVSPMSFNGIPSYQPAQCFTNESQPPYYESFSSHPSSYTNNYPIYSRPFMCNYPSSDPSLNFTRYPTNYCNYASSSCTTSNKLDMYNAAAESTSGHPTCAYETVNTRRTPSYDLGTSRLRGTDFAETESCPISKELSSAERFIAECQTGVKNRKRLFIEKKIEKDLTSKTVNGPNPDLGGDVPHTRNGRYSSCAPNGYNFAQAKKPIFKRVSTKFGKKKNKEFLSSWRWNNCNSEKEWQEKMERLTSMDLRELIKMEEEKCTRTTPAELYYVSSEENPKVLVATQKGLSLSELFDAQIIGRSQQAKEARPPYVPPRRKLNIRLVDSDYESDADTENDLSDDEDGGNAALEELNRKQQHPDRLHLELWYNEKGELNDGPFCKCSRKARKYGIRHNIYNGENTLPKCDLDSNNADKLYHYRITISPPTNFLVNTPTIIKYDDHEFIFEGFSLFSHYPLQRLPACKVIRFNLSYTILYIKEKIPDTFTIRELNLFYKYFFQELMELVDFDLQSPNVDPNDACPVFHFMPRFVRDLPDDSGCEILSMCHVLKYLIANSVPLIDGDYLEGIQKMETDEWQEMVKDLKGSIVTKPGMKPCSIRIDQLDRDVSNHEESLYPDIIHFGIRPPQLSYAGSKNYQRLWRTYVKFRHLLANMPKPSMEDKLKLHNKEMELQKIRCDSKFKRGVTVVLSSESFYKTGIMCDMVQHAMLIPVLVCHLRFHRSLDCLEEKISYKFKDRFLLQLALTHPSYRENFGTNPDHVRNILTNCGIRQPEYGDRRIHYFNTRKRGINTLIKIMSRFGHAVEKQSNIMHNERLEFLGDAVIEFITSIHLYHLFPEIEEGGLATFRAAIVQNQHLTVMAQKLELHQYMLFAHGSDLCHDLELRHAMANCFEAFLGALFLDGGYEVADRVFSETYFATETHLLDLWINYPPHPLQEQEPDGDRKWISTFPLLEKLTEFEKKIGIEFKHIRLLARAFTDRSIGFTNLTMGSNQRLEFLGDTILQLICSVYLYKHFPDHHEGHLSLLRSSLVNNKTQAVVCDDLGMAAYAVYANPKDLVKVKDRADLLEAFLGALYIDKGLKYCEEFCNVCFFPRLQYFIMRQDWNDPKSKLQQCCLTLRSMEGREPDIPVYKVIECKGPTNGRTYTVAVYFRGQRLASAQGHNIQQAEMNAANKALETCKDLFPHLKFQKRLIQKSIKVGRREGKLKFDSVNRRRAEKTNTRKELDSDT